MSIALVNDFNPQIGAGKYAFKLFEELIKKTDVEMVFLEAEKLSYSGTGKVNVLKGVDFPFLKRTLNNLYVFPGKVPEKFELFHCTNQFLGRVCGKRKPCIITCLDLITLLRPKDYGRVLSHFLNRSMKEMDKAEKILAISEHTKQDMVKHFGIDERKVHVTYLGADEKTFKPREKENARKALGLPLGKRIVLSVGADEPRKNLGTVYRAFPEVLKEFPETVFLRVGRKSGESKKLIEGLGLEKNVMHLNGLDEEKIALAYNSADLLVFPSTYEGFGLPVLEAMASGIPVLAANASSVPEITGKAAPLLGPFSEKEWAEEIKRILGTESLRKKLVSRGLEQSKKFSWKRCAEETLKVYEDVLGGKK